MSRLLPFLAILLLGLAAAPAHAGKYNDAGIEDDAAVATLLTKLQAALAKDDRAAVLALVEYPLRVNFPKKPAALDRTTATALFAEIFTPKVRKAITDAKPGELFSNWQGVMLESGEVWLRWSEKSKTVLIYSINP